MSGLLAKREGAFTETAIDGEVVVMSLADGAFFSLTDSAAAIWALLDGTRDRTALLAELAGDHGTSVAAIEPDCDAFLAQLSAAGLLAEG